MITLLRFGVIVLMSATGYLTGSEMGNPMQGLTLGLALGVVSVLLELFLRKGSLGAVICGVAGLGIGLLTARFLLIPLAGVITEGLPNISFALKSVFGYGGLLVGVKFGQGLTLPSLYKHLKGKGGTEGFKKLLDTSVIIDGRIADVCETGFLEGEFTVPQFILQELQYIADSPDSLKRARGRRGLDILNRIQKIPHISVKIVDQDFPKIKEVDSKLVALAKTMDAKVVTNDFNLNKVAELQGVIVLNINELSNAIKPVVLPGESLRVFIIKEGKEYNQGVAYLEDGTMIVVDNGRKLIGKNAEVTVTSVLQTTAGRMIFTKIKEDYDKEEARAAK